MQKIYKGDQLFFMYSNVLHQILSYISFLFQIMYHMNLSYHTSINNCVLLNFPKFRGIFVTLVLRMLVMCVNSIHKHEHIH